MPPDQTGKDAGTDGDAGKDAGAPVTPIEDAVDETTGKTDAQMWAELDAEEGVAAAESVADEPAAASKDDETDETDDEGADDEADETAETPPAEAKDDDKGADKGKQPEVVADAAKELEELRKERERLAAENAKLAHSERSNRERVKALQRKYEGGGQQPPKKKAFADEKGKAFVNEYPEVAAPVAAELEAVRGELDELKAERVKREQEAETARLKENEKVLDAKHPKWVETAASQEFGDWLLKQPRYVQEVVRRNEAAIVDATEAVDIFDRFEAFRSSQGGETNTQRSAQRGAQDGPGGKAAGKNGNGLSGKRQLQLESSSGARSTGPGLVDGIPEDGDYEATWKAFDRMEAREERRRQRA